jgi:hypothetical protein
VLLSLCAHIFVPLIALVAVGVIQFDKNTAIPTQVAEGGTDLCILAIGATGSMFINPKLNGQECPSHMVPFWEWCWVGRWILVDFDFGLSG